MSQPTPGEFWLQFPRVIGEGQLDDPTPPGWPVWRTTYLCTTSPMRMLSKWPWISRCGDYWLQAELRTDGACRIMMMMMMRFVSKLCSAVEVLPTGNSFHSRVRSSCSEPSVTDLWLCPQHCTSHSSECQLLLRVNRWFLFAVFTCGKCCIRRWWRWASRWTSFREQSKTCATNSKNTNAK